MRKHISDVLGRQQVDLSINLTSVYSTPIDITQRLAIQDHSQLLWSVSRHV